MNKFHSLIAALAASTCLAGAASAADMYDPAPSMKDAVLPPPVITDSWTGFFLGVGLGGGIANYNGGAAGAFDVATATPATVDLFSFPLDNGQAMVFGTAQLGYDRRLPSRFVAGVFADYDFGNNAETSFGGTIPLDDSGLLGDTLSFSGSAEVDDSFTLGARLGYLVTPGVLVYGLVGWTHTDLSLSGVYTTNIGGGVPIAFSSEEDLDALTVGAGVETMLWPGFSMKFEYRYADFGGLSALSDLTNAAGAGSAGSAFADADGQTHTARVVLSWRPGY